MMALIGIHVLIRPLCRNNEYLNEAENATCHDSFFQENI